MTELEGCWFRKSRFVGPPLKKYFPRWLGNAHIYAHCGIQLIKASAESAKQHDAAAEKQPLTALVFYSPYSAAR